MDDKEPGWNWDSKKKVPTKFFFITVSFFSGVERISYKNIMTFHRKRDRIRRKKKLSGRLTTEGQPRKPSP